MCCLAEFCYPDFFTSKNLLRSVLPGLQLVAKSIFVTPSTLNLRQGTGWALKDKYETAPSVLGQDSPVFTLEMVPRSGAQWSTAREHSLCVSQGHPHPLITWAGEPVFPGEIPGNFWSYLRTPKVSWLRQRLRSEIEQPLEASFTTFSMTGQYTLCLSLSFFFLLCFCFETRFYTVAQGVPCSLHWPQIHGNPLVLVSGGLGI